MSPDKAKKLVDIFPEMFSDLSLSHPFPLFGFECGDGWYELLKDCITEIKKICQHTECYGSEFPLQVCQVKEKYGTLRFYLNWYTDDIDEIVNDATIKSSRTCEECGNPAELLQHGIWWKTICNDCTKSAK